MKIKYYKHNILGTSKQEIKDNTKRCHHVTVSHQNE